MKTISRSFVFVTCVVSVLVMSLVFLGRRVSAETPIFVGSNGQPAKWGSFSINYTVDNGTLGALNNAQANALTAQAFGAWSGVSSATVTTTQNPTVGLPGPGGDVTTITQYNALGCVGLNPIVYDTDGSITDALFGAGANNSILGFAGPCAINGSNVILGGHGTLNGKPVDGTALSTSRTLAVFTHELGHFLGLGHSQVNLNCLTNQSSCPSGSADLLGVPTMFPILLNQVESPNQAFGVTLAVDDMASISNLYPAATFTTSFGTISGTVFFNDGITQAQGVNVIARRVGDPRVTAVSNVSGMLALANHGNVPLGLPSSSSGSSDPAIRGAFTIPGLPAGSYTLEVESVNASFTGGSGLGPLSQSSGRDENIPLPGAPGCLGGTVCQIIPIVGGLTVSNQNFVLSTPLATLDAFDAASRNETMGTATPISNGTISASISSSNGSDEDYYAIYVTAGQAVTMETVSRRLIPSTFLDTVIDITDALGNRPSTCRTGDGTGPFTESCINDDFTPSGGSLTRDSKLQFTPAASGPIFLHVTDHFGDARPDFQYNLIVSGAAPIPAVTFRPASGQFGQQIVGIASATKNVQVINNSGVAVTLNSLTRGGANSGDFSLVAPTAGSPACSLVGTTNLPAGGGCFFGIVFTAGGSGARTATVSAAHTAAGSPSILTLSGTGTSGPPNDNFASATNIDPTPFSDTQDTSLATQEGVDISLGASGPTPACNATPVPGNDKSIWYKFVVPLGGMAHIKVSSAYDAAVAVGINAGGGSLQSTQCFDFPAGNNSIINEDLTGAVGATLYVMIGAVHGDGGSTTFGFTFTPTGITADLSVSKAAGSATFTEGTPASYTITVSNAGPTGTSPSIPITVSDTLPAGFAFTSSAGSDAGWACSTSGQTVTCNNAGPLASGVSSKVVLNVSVSPPAAASSPIQNKATVSGGGDTTPNNNTSATVSTVVNPAPAPGVDLSPLPQPFGNITVGNTSTSQTITLHNTGTGTLVVSSIAISGTDASQFNLLTSPAGGFTCLSGANNLAPNGSCTMGVNFAPTSAGTKNASVTVTSNAASSPNSVPLTGTGVATNPVPTLTSISPTSGLLGQPINMILTGTNFVSGSIVNFGANADAGGVVTNGGNTLTITIPGNQVTTTGPVSVTVTNPTPGGGTTAAQTFTVNNPVPTITTILPTSATAGGTGFTLTVNGTNFNSSSVVNFNGSARTTTFVNAAQVTASITAADIAAAGTFNVTVTNPAPGGGTSGNSTFTVNNPGPAITTLSPSSAIVGGTAFTLTVNGTNFVSGAVVNFNGTARTTTFVSAIQVTIQVTAADIAVAGTFPVTVTNPAPGGGTSAASNFTVNNPAPTITSLNPNGATAGGSGFPLTVNGTNFVAGSVVNFNGTARTTTFVSATQLTATIPASEISATGSANVTVTNPAPGGGTTTNFGFTIVSAPNPAPTLTSISPTSGVVGQPVNMTLTGTNFIAGSIVNFGGISNTGGTPTNGGTTLTITIPASQVTTAGPVIVTVTNPTPGGGTTAAQTFTANNPVPALTTISPTGAIVGGAAFMLRVTGSNFVATSVVNFNGNPKPTTFVSATQVTASIAAADIAVVGTFPVTVTNPAPGGGTSNTINFAVTNPIPTITTLLPSSATAGGAGFTLTVDGTGFVSGATVNFNGSARITTFVNATQVTALITAPDIAAAGIFAVTVTNPAPGGGTSAASNFTVNNPAPTITTLLPSSATAGGTAFTLTVNGTNFVAASIVKFNGNPKATTFVNATQVTASITAADIAAAGTFNVTVTNPAPGGGTSGNSAFTVNNPVPTITTLSPASAAAGGTAFTLTVNGTNFNSSSVVNFNGSARTTTFISATQVTASITTADLAAAGTFSVTVTNPAPGGGTSGNSTVTVNNPVPTITTLTPALATKGSVGFTLTVNGTNFNSSSVVNFNGSARTTTFVSATQVTASITAADLAAAGTFNVTVTNAAPGGGTSGNSTFTVNNPVPTISTLSPVSTTAGGAAFTLTVNGTGFISGATVKFNGNARTTTFVSATQVTASITPADIATAGAFAVTVTNPAPTTGPSTPLTFTVNNPSPTIATISPTSVTAGGVAFTLTVNGTNFNASSVVNFNGAAKATTFVSATQLTASITAADIAAAGAFNVTVTNPAPGGGMSGNSPFTINNPVPTTTTLSPAGATVGGPAFTLTVKGTNFNASSVVNFNGAAKTTTFVSATQITAAIAAADIATVGQVNVTVTNPAPGGGTTANQVFAIVNFALTEATSTTVQITAGTPATVVFNLMTTPAGSVLPADVNFTCAVPASLTSTTCALNPTKISAGSTSGSTTLTITTMANMSPSPRRQDPWMPYLPWVAMTILAGLMAIFFAGRQKNAPMRGRVAYLTLVLLMIITAGLIGCATTPISTQKGASSVTVTATSGGVSKTTAVNINVN